MQSRVQRAMLAHRIVGVMAYPRWQGRRPLLFFARQAARQLGRSAWQLLRQLFLDIPVQETVRQRLANPHAWALVEGQFAEQLLPKERASGFFRPSHRQVRGQAGGLPPYRALHTLLHLPVSTIPLKNQN